MNTDSTEGADATAGRPAAGSRTSKTALITGASSGIGEAFAEEFAARGFDVVLVARREARLRQVAARLEERHACRAHVLVCDLGRRDAPARIWDALEADALTIDALVNNAGYGVPGRYTTQPWERQEASLHVMVMAMAELTYRLLPGMLERGYGRIINVASLAGLLPAPAGHALYGASKAFAIRFSEALAHEGRPHGVHVTAVCPGFTRSEFHDVTGTRPQVNRLPAWMWMNAEEVARQGYEAVTAGTPVYVNGRVNRTIALLVRYVPQGIVQWFGRRLARSYRRA